MPISRPEKFTVTQTHRRAQSRICFRTDNEPIFRYRRPGLKPESGAQFTRILTKTNSQYAIQKTGVNTGSGHADHQRAPAGIPFLRSPDPLKKISQRTHFSPCGRHARVRGANSQKYSAMPICNSSGVTTETDPEKRRPLNRYCAGEGFDGSGADGNVFSSGRVTGRTRVRRNLARCG